MENSFIVLMIHWWTGWLDMAFLWIPVGLISPHIHKGIHTGNKLSTYREPYRRLSYDGFWGKTLEIYHETSPG
jgi:hypothetical protein